MLLRLNYMQALAAGLRVDFAMSGKEPNIHYTISKVDVCMSILLVACDSYFGVCSSVNVCEDVTL